MIPPPTVPSQTHALSFHPRCRQRMDSQGFPASLANLPDEEQQADHLRYLHLGPPFWHPANFKYLSSPRLDRGVALEGGGRGGHSEDCGRNVCFIGMCQICARPRRLLTMSVRSELDDELRLRVGSRSTIQFPTSRTPFPPLNAGSSSSDDKPLAQYLRWRLSSQLVSKFVDRGSSYARRGIAQCLGLNVWFWHDHGRQMSRRVALFLSWRTLDTAYKVCSSFVEVASGAQSPSRQWKLDL
ncbi:hypothetical protein BKA70DRAFT_1573922 [Coprinopsis sp. MPI-PUGE-AT-0042]|nr:hypothetical protein BKA70DRAFT_1573922 [Coprinopsis sp. MPI-PUGE-AT-0042]